jgi:hypothetical protein
VRTAVAPDQITKIINMLAFGQGLNPALRLSNLPDLLPFRRPEDFARWAEGLRRAGLPE